MSFRGLYATPAYLCRSPRVEFDASGAIILPQISLQADLSPTQRACAAAADVAQPMKPMAQSHRTQLPRKLTVRFDRH